MTPAPALDASAPPRVLALVGHPVRWRLLRELVRSDRSVAELTELVDAPQSLVSYHLRRLRTDELVAMRRSTADRRDAYYRIDLARCGEELRAAGTALHPGLAPELGATPPGGAGGRRARRRRRRVLFLCTGNSARSQIAEALARELSDGTVDAVSAGSNPKALHPNAVWVMRQRGVDISGQRAKHLDEFASERFDDVITLCDRVREVCPEFPGHPVRVHWSVPDPALEGPTDRATRPAFERTTAELETRIRFWLASVHEGR